MKKLLHWATFVAVILTFASCAKEEETSFDEKLLIGKWQTGGTLFYKYNSDYTGSTWDTSDDISEEEAQTFNWTLDGSTLIQTHNAAEKVEAQVVADTRADVPKYYTVTELTATRLSYKDDLGKSVSFTKVD
jgi:hypothetical protein